MSWPTSVPQWCPLSTPSAGGDHTPIQTTDDPPETLTLTPLGAVWEIDDTERAFGLAVCSLCGLAYLREATEETE